MRADVSESTLRKAIAQELAPKCEIMICPAREIIKLVGKDPFAQEPSGQDITRFVSVLHEKPRTLAVVPLGLPSIDDWLLKIIMIQNRFVSAFIVGR